MPCLTSFARAALLTVLLCAGGVSAAAQAKPITTVDALLAQLASLQGMRARYTEEKKISMLKQPLRSEGTVLFAAPGLLLRSVTKPEASAMLLDGDVLRVSDASGVRTIALGESPIVRHFVLTFVYVLRGDRKALDQLYTLSFRNLPSADKAGTPSPGNESWELELVPKQADLKRFVSRARLEGHGVVVDRMTLEEETGDRTMMQFADVDVNARFDAAERARLFRLPQFKREN